MRFLIFGFLIGLLASHIVGQWFDKQLPPAIEVVRGGKTVGYADTSPDLTEFVMVKNARSPGMFMAFPIFGDQKEMEGLT